MSVRVLFVFCCAIGFQAATAAPLEVPFEVTSAGANVGVENGLITNAADGDVLQKTPEPLNLTGVTSSPSAGTLSDAVDQVQSDHLLGPATSSAAFGNPSLSAAMPNSSSTAFAAATPPAVGGSAATASPGTAGSLSTTESATSPLLDGELALAAGPAVMPSGLAAPNPYQLYRMITEMLRRSENLAQPFLVNTPFSGTGSLSFPQMRFPSFIRGAMPPIPRVNDPSMKLVDQQEINDNGIYGKVSTYEGQPDPNTQAHMQTGQYTVNKDGVQGGGVSHYYTSTSVSGSPGSNPMAAASTFLGGIPGRFNAAYSGFPTLRFN